MKQSIALYNTVEITDGIVRARKIGGQRAQEENEEKKKDKKLLRYSADTLHQCLLSGYKSKAVLQLQEPFFKQVE